jgi:hypothetical protein
MSKSSLAPKIVLPIFGCLCAAAIAGLPAQAQNDGNHGKGGGGWRQIEDGMPPVMIHPTRETSEQVREAKRHHANTSNDLYYHGGVGGIGVETTPRVYLVLWGSQWNGNDPSGEESLLVNFFKGAGGSSWLNSVTQYCQGVATGSFSCSSGTKAGNPSGIFVAAWYDNAAAAPSHPTQSQLAAEAVRAAQAFGNTTSSKNASVQYVIATSHGHNAGGFGSQYCAWHSSTSSTAGRIAYTNLPYITDGGSSCGANFNGLGSKAGITIVEGHEMAETITDQFPNGGWLDSGGEENGDKCAWISSGQGASADVKLSTGTFPVQSLWSNAYGSGSGGCVLSY